MNEILTMVNYHEHFVIDSMKFLGEDFKKKIFDLEFIDDEVPFVRFKTSMTNQELFDLSVFCGKEEYRRILLNER
jgi:hypothetical protein